MMTMYLPADTDIHSLTKRQIHKISHFLKAVHQDWFAPPSASCLAPAGEYNLRLGIMKEIRPDMIATATDGPIASEGHPVMIECGVSIGGTLLKPGLKVYRFANRIPLLFEPGNDISTVIANTIKWNLYHIDRDRERIGVFVSIVSTKIPFKGTSKEYIGDDRGILHARIKHCMQAMRVTTEETHRRTTHWPIKRTAKEDVIEVCAGCITRTRRSNGQYKQTFTHQTNPTSKTDSTSTSSTSSTSSSLRSAVDIIKNS